MGVSPFFQCFFGAHGNQITLYLGHQSKSKTLHFAVDVILEHIPLFGTVQHHSPFDTGVKNGHYLQQCPAKP